MVEVRIMNKVHHNLVSRRTLVGLTTGEVRIAAFREIHYLFIAVKSGDIR